MIEVYATNLEVNFCDTKFIEVVQLPHICIEFNLHHTYSKSPIME